MAFDKELAKDVALPLAQAAYAVMDGNPADLPSGFEQTALIRADQEIFAVMEDPHPAVNAMMKDTSIFGLVGRNEETRTAFVSFRGAQDLRDWLHNVDLEDESYIPLPNYGRVHVGFQAVYKLVRGDISAKLEDACTGCTQILLTGHSLGAALAVLAAPDMFRNMPPDLEPRLVTFAGPRVGLADFAKSFTADIEACFRVVNFLDIVPHVPFPPYVHVGAEIDVDSGGDITGRHTLEAYRRGLDRFMAQLPA
jgi:predicted lipase